MKNLTDKELVELVLQAVPGERVPREIFENESRLLGLGIAIAGHPRDALDAVGRAKKWLASES